MAIVEKRLQDMGIELPDTPIPLAAYVPGLKTANTVVTSGQLPMWKGALQYEGKLGENATVSLGYEAAKLCAINCLSVIKSLIGDLDRVKRVIKVVGFVNSTSAFESHPQVINGASELLQAVFCEAGVHARSAVGVSSLPLGAMCEVEITVEYQ